MNLIIKDKIPMFKRGYPTVSDKYNVAGGILEGNAPAKFGGLVKLGSTAGYFQAVTAGNTVTSVNQIGGIVVATNVKLAQDWPGTTVQVNPGEAFNLLIDGFIAVELASTVTIGDVKPNAAVYITAAGEFTGTSDTGKLGQNPLSNVVFTGLYEQHADKYYAEIYVK